MAGQKNTKLHARMFRDLSESYLIKLPYLKNLIQDSPEAVLAVPNLKILEIHYICFFL